LNPRSGTADSAKHPQGKHPQGKHPQGKHPQGEYPQGKHCGEAIACGLL